jgi:hypothetical protein
MKIKGLKNLVEDTFGDTGAGGQAGSPVVVDSRGQKFRSVRSGQDERARTLFGSGPIDAVKDLFTNPGTTIVGALATPRSQLMAAASGRSSGLGFSKETAQQRFTHFRKELPNLVKSYAGMAAGALGQTTGSAGPVGNKDYLGRFLTNPTTNKIANIAGKLLSPLKGYGSAAGDEMAKVASAAFGDIRDASVLGTIETENPIFAKKPEVRQVKIVP